MPAFHLAKHGPRIIRKFAVELLTAVFNSCDGMSQDFDKCGVAFEALQRKCDHLLDRVSRQVRVAPSDAFEPVIGQLHSPVDHLQATVHELASFLLGEFASFVVANEVNVVSANYVMNSIIGVLLPFESRLRWQSLWDTALRRTIYFENGDRPMGLNHLDYNEFNVNLDQRAVARNLFAGIDNILVISSEQISDRTFFNLLESDQSELDNARIRRMPEIFENQGDDIPDEKFDAVVFNSGIRPDQGTVSQYWHFVKHGGFMAGFGCLALPSDMRVGQGYVLNFQGPFWWLAPHDFVPGGWLDVGEDAEEKVAEAVDQLEFGVEAPIMPTVS